MTNSTPLLIGRQRINPGEIGKPFQLLAAAMVFVVLLDGAFLSAAAVLSDLPGVSIALVVAAIVYPPGLLVGLFVLQTKYRHLLLGDDAFVRLQENVAKLRETFDATGFDVTKVPGSAPAAGLSSAETNEIRNRAEELERSVAASLRGNDASGISVVAEAARELGHASLARGRWREGAEHLADYLSVNPKDWGEWFAQGTAYANAREGPETDALSILSYTRALERLPENVSQQTKARLHTYRAGVIKRDARRFAEAESELEIAGLLAEEGSYEADDVHYNKAAILSMRGETDRAMHELKAIGDPWYFGAIAAHEGDYFANLAARDDFRALMKNKTDSRPEPDQSVEETG